MPSKTQENSDEITFFIVEGTHRLSTISINDYGFLLSSKMAQTYLDRALCVLESKRGFDKACLTELRVLKATAKAMIRDYAQFEAFCNDCERFDRLKTQDWMEWVSKWAVRAISRGYRGTVGPHLAYKICAFHARVCSVLTEK